MKVGRTPLHEACLEENFDAVKVLVEAGADLEATDNEGKTPLHLAWNLSYTMAELLLEKGANPNTADVQGNTPLHLSVLLCVGSIIVGIRS